MEFAGLYCSLVGLGGVWYICSHLGSSRKKFVSCYGLGSFGHDKVCCAYIVLKWLSSSILLMVLPRLAYFGSPMIYCVLIGSTWLRLANSRLGYSWISATLLWFGRDFIGLAVLWSQEFWHIFTWEIKKEKHVQSPMVISKAYQLQLLRY